MASYQTARSQLTFSLTPFDTFGTLQEWHAPVHDWDWLQSPVRSARLGLQSGATGQDWKGLGLQSQAEGQDWRGLGTAVLSQSMDWAL